MKQIKQEKILVIPDVHLKAWMFDRALEIMEREKIEQAVCLGDLVDDFDQEMNTGAYEGIFNKILDFDEAHPNTLWCYGNHDISYLWGKLESGYSPYQEQRVIQNVRILRDKFQDRLAFAHSIGKCLFTHAGVTWDFLDNLRYRGFKVRGIRSIEDVRDMVNQCGEKELWNDDSSLWVRPLNCSPSKLFNEYGVLQVTGHTPVRKSYQNGSILFCDTFSTYADGTPYGDQSFQIVTSDGQWLGSVK